jgi:hypothetical protein
VCGAGNRLPIVRGRDVDSAAPTTRHLHQGACVRRYLRFLLGDGPFFDLLRRFATDPCHRYHFATTADSGPLAAQAAGGSRLVLRSLSRRRRRRAGAWAPPRRRADRIVLRWDGEDFELPLEVRTVSGWRRVEMPRGRGELEVPRGSIVQVDPRGWVLAESAMP